MNQPRQTVSTQIQPGVVSGDGAAPVVRRQVNPASPDLAARSSIAAAPKPQRRNDDAVAAQKPADVKKPGSPGPRATGGRENDIAAALLNLEREARHASTEAELGYLMVNGSRVAVQYRQALLLMRSGPKKHRAVAVSSLSAIDRNSTFIRWVERLAAQRIDNAAAGSETFSFDARKDAEEGDIDASSYPFSQIALVPLALRDGTVFAHLMFTRESEWDERSLTTAGRICETFSHSWEALTGPKRLKRKLQSRTAWWLAGGCLLAAAAFYPVPLSVLAPGEVTPENPFVVAAPIDGAIKSVAVQPNEKVKKGDLLFTYSATDLRNRVKLAGQAVAVAEARYQQSLRSSFSDASAKRELSIAQSELQLKAGEYDYARELLAKADVKAGRDGLVLFADKDTWTGRPVATGERIMRIADPAMVELTVQVPVGDAIVMEEGASVELYLDSDPLNPVNAILENASFHAQTDGQGVLSYRVRARFESNGNQAKPRIGLRGTAKVFGDDVSLAYYLFRKPLSAIRQWTGY